MQPAVQYVSTSDGVRIAYTVSGSGPPFVVLTDPSVSNVDLEWSQPVLRSIYGCFAESVTLIRLDIRGTGMSERVQSVGPETIFAEVRAVVEQLGLRRYGLAGVQILSPAALIYASRFPDEVTHLVLIDGCLSIMQLFTSPQLTAVIAAGQTDWVTGTEAIGAFTFGTGRDESVGLGEYIRSCIGPEFFPLAMQATNAHDATKVAGDVRCPTLVVKHAAHTVPIDVARTLTAAIPHATLAMTPGLWADDPTALADRILGWLATTEAAPERSDLERTQSKATANMCAILFTDLEGHTAMMNRLGDDAGRALLREHERIVRSNLAIHGGDEVKTMGDGFMASFTSAAAAAQCAIDLQRAFASAETLEALRIRIGLHAGEPIVEDGDLFGASVILASRISAKAMGGEIFVSDVIRGLLAGKSFLFADRGETMLRGFEDSVRIYELRWSEGE